MADIVGDGPVTKSFLEKELQQFFRTNAKLIKAEGDVISKGLGFTSDVMRVNLTWDSDVNLPTKVIVKAPKIANMQKLLEDMGASDAAQATVKFVPMAHAIECKAMTLLSTHHVIPIPKIYGYCLVGETEPGLIIMEDLGDKGGLIESIAKGLTLEQWRNVVDVLADLHGWSLITDQPWRQEFPGVEVILEMMKGFMAAAPAQAKKAVEKYPEYLGHINLEFVTEQLSQGNLLAVFTDYRKVMPDVLTHGDTWINNIFFEKNPDGTLNDKVLAFIDWQISMKSCGVFDLTRFEGWCVNHKMRRKHALTILRRYYDRVKAIAGNKFSATYPDIEEVYFRITVLNGIFGVAGSEMFLDKIARVDEDPTGERKKEMLERIRAAYDDAVEYVKNHETEKTRL